MINKDDLQKIHVLGQKGQIGGAGQESSDIQLVSVEQAYDDEISLLDLWMVLTKRRNALLAIVLAFLVTGIIGAVLKAKAYDYSAVLQIGVLGAVSGGEKGLAFIDSPDNVLTKLSKSYIPLAMSQFLKDNPEVKNALKITAKMSKNSDLITLEARGAEKNADHYLDVIQRVIGLIQKDHQPQMDITRSRYELSLEREKMALAELENPLTLQLKEKKFEINFLQSDLKMKNLQDQRLIRVAKQQLVMAVKNHKNSLLSLAESQKQLKSDLVRLNDVDRLLEKRATELSDTIQNELKSRQLTVSKVKTGPEAMTVLLLDNQIQTNRNLLAGIEERLTIKQPSLREKLNNQIKENSRSQAHQQKLIIGINEKLQKMDINNSQAQQTAALSQSSLKLNKNKMLRDHKKSLIIQQQKIDAISYSLKGLRDTQALTIPMQSLEPVGIGKSVIVIISLIAGLFVGVFSVFFLEFLSKVKEKQDTLAAD